MNAELSSLSLMKIEIHENIIAGFFMQPNVLLFDFIQIFFCQKRKKEKLRNNLTQ